MKKLALICAALLGASLMYAQQAEQYNQYGVKVSVDPLLAEAQDGILVLRSKDDSGYKIWLDNRVQADAGFFFGEPDYADPISNGASIRRARFAVKCQLDKNWYGEVDMDMANGIFELKDAIIRFDGIKNSHIQIGNFKEFFSIQRNNSSRYLQFMERPMIAQALAPSRHIGINYQWANKGWWLSGGVFGQEIAGSEEREYVEESSKSYGYDEGVSFTGKAVWQPGWDKTDWGMHVGAAASYRTPKTSDETFGKARFSTRNTNSINRRKYIDTGEFGPYDHEFLYTGEFAGYWKGLRWEAVYMANNTALKDGTSKACSGWYAQAGWLLFGGRQRYDSAGAKFTRVQRGRSWGDVELCARIEYIDLNCDKALAANDQKVMGGSAMAYALGLNYYINDHVKFMLDYQFTDNDRFASGKGNKFYCGVDETGKAVKNPYNTVGKAGVDYSAVTMRFEIDF